MGFRRARKVMWGFYLLGVLIGLIWGLKYPLALGIGIAIILAGLGVGLLFWCCPHCGRSLPARDGDVQYCPYCGEKLD